MTPVPASFPADVTFTLMQPSQLPGRAINDVEACGGGICANDYSFNATNPDALTATVTPPVDADTVSVLLHAFDYGGTATVTVSFFDTATGTVTESLPVPLDTDGDQLPDDWELLHAAAGFDPLNAHSFSTELTDGSTDLDTMLDNPTIGDDLLARFEFRGVLFDPEDPLGRGHVRLDPTEPDLFVRGDFFANSLGVHAPPASLPCTTEVLPFSVDWASLNEVTGLAGQPSAFEAMGIALHDVTGNPTFNNSDISNDDPEVGEPPNLDILIVTNVLCQTATIAQPGANGFINRVTADHWDWDPMGESFIAAVIDGNPRYAYFVKTDGTVRRGTFHYNENELHYFFNRPYVKCSRRFWIGERRWRMKREVRLDRYLGGAWDEGMNCSRYRSQEIEELISHQIEERELIDGEDYTCPIEPTACVRARERYGVYADRLLHPLCLAQQPAHRPWWKLW